MHSTAEDAFSRRIDHMTIALNWWSLFEAMSVLHDPIIPPNTSWRLDDDQCLLASPGHRQHFVKEHPRSGR